MIPNSESKQRACFWAGYELATGRFFPNTDDEDTWHGFTKGFAEREGFFRVTKWKARRKRFKDFFRINLWYIRRKEFGKVRFHASLIDVRQR